MKVETQKPNEKLHDLVQRNPDVGCWVEKETNPETGEKTWLGFKDKAEYDEENQSPKP